MATEESSYEAFREDTVPCRPSRADQLVIAVDL